MSEEKKTGRITRREFLKDAGLIVGGATIGSIALASACGGTKTETVTTTQTVGTATVPTTVTTTVTGPGATSTVTVTGNQPVVPPAASDLVTLNVNNQEYKIFSKPYWPLSYVLRDKLGLFGTKVGCEFGQCASCTVLQDGMPVLSCLTLAVEAQNKKITTIEGLSSGISLSPLQQKWLDNEAFQCGFCTPGFMMAATALLASNSKPTVSEVREAFAGHICSCYNFRLYIENTVGGV